MPEQTDSQTDMQADPKHAHTATAPSLSDLDAQLAALSTMSLAQMRESWTRLTGKPAPGVRSTLLRLAIAWELQAEVYGGLTRRCEQRLTWLAAKNTPAATAAPGTRLVREWNGALHIVTVTEEGTILWDGKTWRSLSQVARAITGTRWSGPAFFGLKARSGAA